MDSENGQPQQETTENLRGIQYPYSVNILLPIKKMHFKSEIKLEFWCYLSDQLEFLSKKAKSVLQNVSTTYSCEMGFFAYTVKYHDSKRKHRIFF